jgi:hypothetical protein
MPGRVEVSACGRYLTGGVFMAFFASFIQTTVKFIIMAAVAGCGLFLGKKLRDRKDV